MKKLDIIGIISNVVLSIFYIPFSFFSYITLMASETAIGATNPWYIYAIDFWCFLEFFIPLQCFAAIILSVILRIKKHSVPSFLVQFAPIAAFALNLLLLFIIDFIPKMA